ncbi:thioredoxin-like protein [Geopyxis carbonaria]|nr:thioredoxin-like protein [Geopyxis carbonaria]
MQPLRFALRPLLLQSSLLLLHCPRPAAATNFVPALQNQIPFQNFQASFSTTPGVRFAMTPDTTIYDFKPLDMAGVEKPMEELRGKVVLIVNVASKCGFTSQYEGLEKLYETYKDQGLVVLGFPCNQFGGQEPGSAEEIQNFCTTNYGIKFPIMSKIEVNGDNAHPLYQYLKEKKPGIMGMKRVKWNYEKFLIGRNGEIAERYASTTKPESIAAAIERELKKEAKL